MSIESISQFLSMVSADSALKEKLAAITDSVNFIQIAEDSGYNFTLEDLQAYIAQHNNGELSEDELEAVAGGHSFNIGNIRSLLNLSSLPNLPIISQGGYSYLDSLGAPGGNDQPPRPKGPKPGGPGGHGY